MLFTKGAESAILPFATSGEIEKTRLHVDDFALVRIPSFFLQKFKMCFLNRLSSNFHDYITHLFSGWMAVGLPPDPYHQKCVFFMCAGLAFPGTEVITFGSVLLLDCQLFTTTGPNTRILYTHTHIWPPHHVIGRQYPGDGVLDRVDLWSSSSLTGSVI